MPPRPKTRQKKKKDSLVIQDSSKLLRNEKTHTPLQRNVKPKPAAGRKRPAPVDSESEEERTTTRKTPKRAVRQKVETGKKQRVSEKRDSVVLETQQQVEEEEARRIPTKKKTVQRKSQQPVASKSDRTSSPVIKPSTSVGRIDEDEKPVRIPVKNRNGSARTKKVVVDDLTEERVGGDIETVPSRRQPSGQKKGLSKNAVIQVSAEVEHDDGTPPIKIAKKVIKKNKTKVAASNDRALQPVEILIEEEENVGRESPVVKKKVVKKVVKKKAAKVMEQPVINVDDANENLPEEPETTPLVKKKMVKRKSILSVELPLTPSRKRTVPVVRETADGNTPEQRTAKVSKIVATRKALQHSPESSNRIADSSRHSGNGTGDEEREYTSIPAAGAKTSAKRTPHAPDEAVSRRTQISKAKPTSNEEPIAEQNENNDDAVLKPVRRLTKKTRLPKTDEPEISSRPNVSAKSNKRAEAIECQISIPPITETKERQPDRDRPAPFIPVSSLLRSPGPSGTCTASPPSNSYGKPFVFSGIPTGDHYDTVIPLPTSDTPMIQKNKDFREANRRRSSFVMRGKRASSMSGGSLIALPHPSVPSESFFRHIAAEAPEPVRMKQLLAWCARRVEIPAGKCVDPQALEIAQQVRERIITAILGGKISTSWYNRKEDDVLPEITGPKELKEHPQNVDNRRLLKEHEDTIERLEKEEAAWTATLREYNSRHAAIVDSCPVLSDEPILIDVEGEGEERRVMKDVMDTAMAAVEEQVGEDPMDVDDEWLESTMAEVEVKVDRLHSTLHTAGQFNRVAREYTEDLFSKLVESISARRGNNDRANNDVGGGRNGGCLRNGSDPMELLRMFAASASASSPKTSEGASTQVS